MRLIITRHGQTIANAQKIYQGQLDGELSEIGKNQAAKLATRILEIHTIAPITAIYSSPLKRAYDTARIIQTKIQLPISTHDNLKEAYLGKLEGQTVKVDDFDNLDNSFETFDKLCVRATNFLQLCKDTHTQTDTLLIVAHGGLNKALLCSMIGTTEYIDFAQQNCCINICDYNFKTQKWKIVSINDTNHII